MSAYNETNNITSSIDSTAKQTQESSKSVGTISLLNNCSLTILSITGHDITFTNPNGETLIMPAGHPPFKISCTDDSGFSIITLEPELTGVTAQTTDTL